MSSPTSRAIFRRASSCSFTAEVRRRGVPASGRKAPYRESGLRLSRNYAVRINITPHLFRQRRIRPWRNPLPQPRTPSGQEGERRNRRPNTGHYSVSETVETRRAEFPLPLGERVG